MEEGGREGDGGEHEGREEEGGKQPSEKNIYKNFDLSIVSLFPLYSICAQSSWLQASRVGSPGSWPLHALTRAVGTGRHVHACVHFITA